MGNLLNQDRGLIVTGKVWKSLYAFIAVTALISCATPQMTAIEKCELAYYSYWGTDWDKVIELTTEATMLEPDHPWPYSMRGAAYSAKGQHEQALQDLDTAIDLSPDFFPAFTNRGLAYMRMNDFENAENDLRMALNLNPRDITSQVRLSEALSAQGKDEEACTFMMVAIKNGFSDMKIIEEEFNFESLLFSECFQEVISLYNKLKELESTPKEQP
jgi:tetratricopeptide (TPR) repeat protein